MRMTGQAHTTQWQSYFEGGDELLKNASLGVHLVDGRGTILWANETELKFLGYSMDEYIGKSITEFHVDQDVIERILGILTGGGMLNVYPARLRAKDGSTKHVLINSNVYREGGEFRHTRCFTSGISEAVYDQLRVELLSAGG